MCVRVRTVFKDVVKCSGLKIGWMCIVYLYLVFDISVICIHDKVVESGIRAECSPARILGIGSTGVIG